LAALSLAGCDRFDVSSWLDRQSHDVDGRFRESMEDLQAPSTPVLERDDQWSMLMVTDFHCWVGEIPTSMVDVADYLLREPVDFVMALGDVVDSGAGAEYDICRTVYEILGTPCYTVIGNHDVWNEGWTHYRRQFGPSVYTMSLRAGRRESLLIALDAAGATLGGLQRPWFERQLAETTAQDIFVFAHYPLWVPVETGYSQMGAQQEVYDLLNLLRRYEVRAHFSGHTHRWARTNFSGTELFTLSAMKEAAANRCALRVDVASWGITYSRIPFGDRA
jgi:3',5'-cyclic AMP phosphodiesterase CpdA